MAEYVYSATVSGNTLHELAENTRMMAEILGTRDAAAQPQPQPQPQQDAASETQPETPTSGRRRGRPPASASASSSTNGAANGAANDAHTQKSVDEMRQEATDILKACWGKKDPPGAERVVALQQKFGVTRFSELADDKVPALLQAAVALQNELAGGGGASDTGPF